MTDTAAHADVVFPATTQLEHLDVVWSWGHHYVTLNEPAIAPLGEARRNSEIFRLLARTAGLRPTPASTRATSRCSRALLEGDPAGIGLAGLRERGWAKIDRGQGPTPHAEGGFATPSGKLELRCDRLREAGLTRCRSTTRPARSPTRSSRSAIRWRCSRRRPTSSSTPRSPTAAASTPRSPSRSSSSTPATPGRAESSTARRCAWPTTAASFTCRAVVSDDARAGVPVAPMGWWNRDYAGGRSPQATTPQRADDAARRADVQRQPRRDRGHCRPRTPA